MVDKRIYKTVEEAAEAYDKHPKTILRWLGEGKWVGEKGGGKEWNQIHEKWEEPAPAAPVAPPEPTESDKEVAQLVLDTKTIQARTAKREAERLEDISAHKMAPQQYDKFVADTNKSIEEWKKRMAEGDAALADRDVKLTEDTTAFTKYKTDTEAALEAKKDEQEAILTEREEALSEQQKVLDDGVSELQEDRKALAAGEATLERKKTDLVNEVNKMKADYGESWQKLINYLRGSCGWSPSQRHNIINYLNPIALALFGKSYEFDWRSAHIVEANRSGDKMRTFEIDKRNADVDCPLTASVNGSGIDEFLRQGAKMKKKPQISKAQQEENALISERLDYLAENCPKLYKTLDSLDETATEVNLLNAMLEAVLSTWWKLFPEEYDQMFNENKYQDEIFGDLIAEFPQLGEKVYQQVEEIA